MVSKTPKRKYARVISALLCVAFAALFIGCATDPVQSSVNEGRAFSIETPVLLSSPALLLLTNVDSFSAQVAVRGASSTSPSAEGNLLGRRGRFLLSKEDLSGKKQISPGSLYFIWNSAEAAGYALMEALQGYAPISAPNSPALVNTDSTNVNNLLEKLDGHTCRKEQTSIKMSDGSTQLFQLWRATDLDGFPLRIDRLSGGPRMTITFSKVELCDLEPQIFQVPSGFTRYANPDALATELVARGAKFPKPWSRKHLQRIEDDFTDYQMSPRIRPPSR